MFIAGMRYKRNETHCKLPVSISQRDNSFLILQDVSGIILYQNEFITQQHLPRRNYDTRGEIYESPFCKNFISFTFPSENEIKLNCVTTLRLFHR